jgi:hypothetical protein
MRLTSVRKIASNAKENSASSLANANLFSRK